MSLRPPCILIADDQRDVREALRLLFKSEGYAAETFDSPDALIHRLRTRTADAVLMDLNYTRDTTSGDEGLEAVARIRPFDGATPIIVMTAWAASRSRWKPCVAAPRTSSRNVGEPAPHQPASHADGPRPRAHRARH
jgi:CheY-like chemotaxis protein